ncbi:hypothetical protein DBR11_22170 [Pedobacter sp. HMWF019]|nr:hypothetical protein DBR11_22170 [Pedobacter sp. HMWF019]
MKGPAVLNSRVFFWSFWCEKKKGKLESCLSLGGQKKPANLKRPSPLHLFQYGAKPDFAVNRQLSNKQKDLCAFLYSG